MEADKMASAKTTQLMHNDYNDSFTRIWCFKGIFLLKIKDGIQQYQKPPRCVANVLKEPFRKELEKLQGQQILAPLEEDETAE